MKLLKLLRILTIALFAALPAAAQHTVTLTWSASSQPAGVVVTGYNVYQTTTSGSGYVKLTATPVSATTFTTGALDGGAAGGPGVTYYYVVTAICPSCTVAQESAFSAEVSALIPAPLPAGPPNAPTNPKAAVN